MQLNLEYIFYHIYHFFAKVFGAILQSPEWVKSVSFALSVLFAVGIIYNIFNLLKLRKKQLTELVRLLAESPAEERVSKWDKIKKYLESDNSSDWRRAILEADNILEDILKRVGYRGVTMAERLKKIKPYKFQSLNDVWEAHKIRNRIAHEGVDFKLTKEEAGRVLELYEKGLKELEFI